MVLNPSHTSALLRTKKIKVLVASISGFSKDQVSIWNHSLLVPARTKQSAYGICHRTRQSIRIKPALWLQARSLDVSLKDPH